MVLSKTWLTRCWADCAGWSVPLLFANYRGQVFSPQGPFIQIVFWLYVTINNFSAISVLSVNLWDCFLVACLPANIFSHGNFVCLLHLLGPDTTNFFKHATDILKFWTLVVQQVLDKKCRPNILPRGYKTFLCSTEHEIYPAHKCYNANNCWHYSQNSI